MSTLNTYNLKSPDSANTNLALDASGNVAIQAGSASTPSVYVTGDANTGLYSPGADQIAVATGGTARVYIDASGRVGISTMSAARSAILTAKSTNQTIASGNGQLSVITSDAQAADVGGSIVLGGQSGVADWVYASLSGRSENNSYAGYLAFATSSSGGFTSERARIDSSGRLLVGTSTSLGDNAQLQIANGAGITTNPAEFLRASNDAAGSYILLTKSRGSHSAPLEVSNGDLLGAVVFKGYDGAAFRDAAYISGEADGTWTDSGDTSDNPGRLVFSTTADGASSPTERMRINNAGRVSISDAGSIDPTFGLLEITRAQDQPDNRFHLAFHRVSNKICGMGFLDNSQTFAIQNADNNTGNGVTLGANGTSWGTTSDERKKRIGLPIENGLDKIADWRCVYFSYLNESEGVQRVGLIAQDVQQTLPEAVSVEEDEIGTLQLKYTELIPVLVKALQESKERIEILEAKVAALESA